MTTDHKKLTEAPKDLKEAIDWVIQISELKQLEKLADALEKFLKEDAGLVIWEVREVFDVIKNNIIDKFDKMHGFGPQHYKGCLSSATEGLKDVKRSMDAKKGNLQTAIESLVKGLKSFVRYKGTSSFNNSGIIKNNGATYTFAYNDAKWIPDDAPKCAAILLGILPAMFFGVTLIYWKCSNNTWKNVYTPPKYFLKQMGFSEDALNGDKKGSDILSQLTSFTELSKANVKNVAYPAFLEKLQGEAPKSAPSTSSPLTSLYLLSYYFTTNFLYIVEPTSPASPSFLGYSGLGALAGGAYGFNLGGLGTIVPLYTPLTALVDLSFDCPSNLKEAIDWILRVTGKDGGGGGDNTRYLAKAVKDLIEGTVKEVDGMISKGHNNGNELQNLKDALEKAKEWLKKDVEGGLFGNSPGRLGRLSDGLAAFIGYGGKGTFSNPPTAGRLTGTSISHVSCVAVDMRDGSHGWA
ncbi:variant erythrocyte surface antigen-1 family protein [Babesia caballi]|uniref:Variant erythrocyte surface antigen-1 family protein n=1 Tax=Babesia caballi TaxID=5871 RepID=A0AAV4LMN9_BABCB|nr:variant erythrocyte surface antigen-1 family protein [Babesia caballi]